MFIALAAAVAHAETATLGSVADTWVRDGSALNYGADPSMYLVAGAGRVGYVRFDLSSLGAILIESATVKLTKTTAPWGRSDTLVTGRFALVGLDNIAGNTAQDWDELVLASDNVGSEFAGSVAEPIDLTKVTNLDGDDTGVDVTETITDSYTVANVTGNDLVSFLQARVNDGGLATFIAAFPGTDFKGYWLASKEATTETERPVLEITYTPVTHAYLPNPEDGATVPLDTVTKLSWNNPDPNNPGDTITSDVYFGTTVPDPNTAGYGLALIADDVTATEVNIPSGMLPLSASTTYHWVVDCTDPNTGLLPGEFWSFYVSGAPEVITDPVGTAKFENETADFSATFTTDSAILSGYPKWYKVGDANELDTPDDPDITIALDTPDGITFTSTLSIANLEGADEAEYYCEIANTNGTAQTAPAKLIVKRLLAHWPFDTDAGDLQGNYDGVASGAPVYDTGMVGNAIVFDGSDDFITLPSGFDDFSAGMTVSVWAYPTAANNYGRFIDFANGAGVDNIMIYRVGTSDDLRFNDLNGSVTVSGALDLNAWQMFVITMDDAGNVIIYKDGLQIQTGTVGLPDVVTRTLNYIGESNYTSDALYAGKMDDMRIYNYDLTADDVADLYSNVVGDYCRNQPAYDLTGDCIVNMDDLAYFVGSWLDCGFYPNPSCQ